MSEHLGGHITRRRNDSAPVRDRYGCRRTWQHARNAVCAIRLWRQGRRDLAVPEEIPAELLAAQRRAVYSRMGEKPRSFHAWVPALAMATVLALGVYVYAQPVTQQCSTRWWHRRTA